MGMVSAAIRSALKVGAGVAAGAVAFGATATTEDKSGALLQDIVDRVKRIERQLGVKTGGAKEEKYGAGFPYFPKGCTSLLSKHLTVDVYEQLKDKITPNGFTLVAPFSQAWTIPIPAWAYMLVTNSATLSSARCSTRLSRTITAATSPQTSTCRTLTPPSSRAPLTPKANTCSRLASVWAATFAVSVSPLAVRVLSAVRSSHSSPRVSPISRATWLASTSLSTA